MSDIPAGDLATFCGRCCAPLTPYESLHLGGVCEPCDVMDGIEAEIETEEAWEANNDDA